jgi:predicted alpha/beta superfamily hydrolase
MDSINSILSNDELAFRKKYELELRKKKQQIYDIHIGYNELDEERKQVNQQALKTPGRMGEIIKNEEIDREFSRRYKEHEKHSLVLSN